MIKTTLFLSSIILTLVSCKNEGQKEIRQDIKKNDVIALNNEASEMNPGKQDSLIWFVHERIPYWVIESNLIQDNKIKEKYQIDIRLNPFYLEDDFNGDGHPDIALPIIEIDSQKTGFVIIHGSTSEIHIIGAGTLIKNALSDDLNYISIWRISREKSNPPGVEKNGGNAKDGYLILDNHSISIEASEIGGGLIYWDGKKYVYFHQTC